MAANYNRIVIIGRVTGPCEIYKTAEYTKAMFTLAVNRNKIDKKTGAQECDFINVGLWGNRAQTAVKLLTKGALILVEGRLRISRYEKDHVQKTYAEVVVDTWQFMTPRSQQEKSEGATLVREDEQMVLQSA